LLRRYAPCNERSGKSTYINKDMREPLGIINIIIGIFAILIWGFLLFFGGHLSGWQFRNGAISFFNISAYGYWPLISILILFIFAIEPVVVGFLVLKGKHWIWGIINFIISIPVLYFVFLFTLFSFDYS
jgi:hypothetical protein